MSGTSELFERDHVSQVAQALFWGPLEAVADLEEILLVSHLYLRPDLGRLLGRRTGSGLAAHGRPLQVIVARRGRAIGVGGESARVRA